MNGITIGSVAFVELTVVTDRRADRSRYSVCSSRPHLANAAMQRKNDGYWTTRRCHLRLSVLSFRSFGGICETASCPVRVLTSPRDVQSAS